MELFLTCLECIYIIIDNNDRLLITFQSPDVLLHEPIEIDELIKSAFQSIILIFESKK